MMRLGGGGDRFGDCLCVYFANLDTINLQTQNSPDLLPKFRSLVFQHKPCDLLLCACDCNDPLKHAAHKQRVRIHSYPEVVECGASHSLPGNVL